MGLLKIKEVGQIVRLSPQTVRKLIEDGQIPAKKIGRSLRVDSADLALWLKGITAHGPNPEMN